MALEVSAAVIGILAAAGKVGETLGPFVSAYKNAPKHSQTILTDVNQIRTILLGLQTLFDNLGASPGARRQMIQLDHLVAALTDGVLLFSELEALVDRLGNADSSIAKRMAWAKSDSKLSSLIDRLQSFRSSVSLMLNILQWYTFPGSLSAELC
jgi:hypothetical protein